MVINNNINSLSITINKNNPMIVQNFNCQYVNPTNNISNPINSGT